MSIYECLYALAADLDDSYLRGDAIRDKSVGSETFILTGGDAV